VSISFTNYVEITSGVSGAGQVRDRELITRVFSINPLIPANSFAEFENAADVGTYFGTTSEEYKRAAYYFGFISKQNLQPQKISFASWVEAARAPFVIGDGGQTETLAQLKAITTGYLNLTLGAATAQIGPLNLSTATTLAGVAALIQTAVQAGNADPQWAGALVTYNATGPLGANFELQGAVAGAGALAILPVTGGGADIGAALGWESALAVVSQGSAAMTLTQTMNASVAGSNNFASFCYIPTLDEAQILELQTWQGGYNLDFIGEYAVTADIATEVSAAIIATPGGAMTLTVPGNTDYPEMMPGMIMAATDYTKPGASQNYMFQQTAGQIATVTDDADQKAYDNLRVNYFGQTQQAGAQIVFYQRGVLTGNAQSPSDMNVYANEIWFKGVMGDAFMSVLLADSEISANQSGRATVLAIIDSVIAQGIDAGVISVANLPALTQAQIVAITNLSGSATAWRQVAALGYWRTMQFNTIVTEDGRTEYQAVYTLIYTKNNAIRKVIGTHNLI
jgi:hypothetical protein